MEETRKNQEQEDAGQCKGFIENIIENYRKLEESIVAQLGLCNKDHGTETGTLREDIWLQLFEQIIPKKFCIEHSIFIIDSYGNKSREVDLAIVDQNYTPYIFQFGRLKFIPIEAVAAVVECKSKTVDNISEWLKSVTDLKTSMQSVTRMATGIIINGEQHPVSDEEKKDKPSSSEKTAASSNIPRNSSFYPTQTATRPIRIFCGYQSKQDMIKEGFDFSLVAGGKDKANGIHFTFNQAYANLEQWYRTLNHDEEKLKKENREISCPGLTKDEYKLDHYRIFDAKGEEVPLMSFDFLLNQLLMLINNPILFPHVAYANMFNRNILETQVEETDRQSSSEAFKE